MIVIADTSPINYLLLIGHIEVLPHFYSRIVIPKAVWWELQDKDAPDVTKIWSNDPPWWLEVRELQGSTDPSLNHLDWGEREAIVLAEELRAGRLIVDEALARRAASLRGIEVIGTLGVLRNAAPSVCLISAKR